MNSKLKPVSRLSIVFILAIAISGSILTYFSINNIANLRELTEKRIREEQQELFARFLNALQEKMESVGADYKSEISPYSILRDSMIQTAARHDFITLPFILDNDRSLFYPYYKQAPSYQEAPQHSDRFNDAFMKGEKAEFVSKDLKTSQKHFSSALTSAISSNDSVKALNALGRVSVKQSDDASAISHYNAIIVQHFSAVSTNGIPYVYYVLPQLLKITNADNRDKITPLVIICLEKMNGGAIPLNINTEELLKEVVEWIQIGGAENASRITNLVEHLRQQLQFVESCDTDLVEIIKNGGMRNHLNDSYGFKVVHSLSGDCQISLLVNTRHNHPNGFVIDREILFNAIVKANPQTGFEFDYIIEFPAGYKTNAIDPALTYVSQLNPHFPGQLIQIKAGDEDLIKKLILRRSWIYGIASSLLLVAMLLGVVLILRDIAREKHVARLQSDFISNVTHELKTPLTSIYMFAESLLLGRVKSGTVKKEYLSIILKESERLQRMINNILEFSKMEKGKHDYHFAYSNLATILNAAIQDMDYWFEKEQFEVVTELDETINAEIDPEKMKQVFGNLLSNAVKYSGNTKKIIIWLFSQDDHICIEVEDRGIGMPEDRLQLIFENFYRIDQKENISGTGLGLTVVKEIVETHKGKIIVTSEIGKGSKFSIILNQQIEKG